MSANDLRTVPRASEPPAAQRPRKDGGETARPAGTRATRPPGTHATRPPGIHTTHPPGIHTTHPPGTHATRPLGTHAGSEPHLVLDRYRLLRRLGAGAFGTVWMARDERLERDVAVKIVPRERVIHSRFEREARAAARLSHPAIVTLYEAAFDDDGAYLVSELVRGGTLGQLLDAGRLSDRDIVSISLTLTEALSHAHAQGIVHRDVKPSNVLVPERPTSPLHPAKLTDFGVARVLGGDSLTRTGDVVGTAAYMAPEQAEGRDAGATADLYSLALVTYEALTGVNPVRTGTAAVRARRLGAHLPPLRRQRRDLPRELGQAIDLALRPRPRERGTLEELHQALASSLEQVEDTPGVVDVPWQRRTRPRDRRPEPPPVQPNGHLGAPAPDPPAGAARDREIAPKDPGNPGHAPVPWPQRAIAAATAAAASAWLAGHLLTSGSGAPAAMIAAALVIALPRIGWVSAMLGLAVAAAVHHRPGGALVLVIAVLSGPLLLPRRGASWPLAAMAPALGLVGLAGAWPAATARLTTSAYRRAALAATGWMWLLLAAPVAGSDLYVRRPRGAPPPEIWTASLRGAVHDVLAPILTTGAFAGAAVWAVAAALLPSLLRGRRPAVDIVLVTAWSAMLVSATEVTIAIAGGGAHRAYAPPTAVAGAIAGAVLALAPTLFRAWRRSSDWANPHTELP